MLPAFEVKRPATLPEALQALAECANAYPLAGGTNLIVDARAGRLTPDRVVDISRLPELRGIEARGDEIRVGATTTIAELMESDVIARHADILRQASESFANALIRNRATVGGNLVNAAPCADTAPAFLVLDAQVELASAEGTRREPLETFLIDAFETTRRPNELLTAVWFPVPSESTTGRFEKMGLRKISCMAKVDVAVSIGFGDDGTCEQARIALGAASPVAVRAEDAEAELTGKKLTDETIEAAAAKAAATIVPRAGSEYKRQVVHALARRLLAAAAEKGARR